MVLLHEDEEPSLMEDNKNNKGKEAPHLSEP